LTLLLIFFVMLLLHAQVDSLQNRHNVTVGVSPTCGNVSVRARTAPLTLRRTRPWNHSRI